MLDWELDLNESRSSLKAVCCEDKLHCCPEGTQCDLAHSRCIQSSLPSIPMLVKFPARKRVSTPGGGHMTLTTVDQNCWSCSLQTLCWRKSLVIYLHCAFDYCLFSSSVSSVRCPGGTSSCPDGSTCCLLASGGYGCCPFSEVHCRTLQFLIFQPTVMDYFSIPGIIQLCLSCDSLWIFLFPFTNAHFSSHTCRRWSKCPLVSCVGCLLQRPHPLLSRWSLLWPAAGRLQVRRHSHATAEENPCCTQQR